MNFVFVDETGDPGSELSKGTSSFFGMTLISVMDKDYEALQRLLSQVHWLCGTASPISLGANPVRALNLLRGLQELARNRVVSASGLYISKECYGGRYTKWSDIDVPSSGWAYYLRNYLLRHLLEFHFAALETPSEPMDLILDRVLLTEKQRKNTIEYLNSKTAIPLRAPFRIPHVTFLTVADSQYVGGLEIAHVLSDILRGFTKGTIPESLKELSDFMRIEHFIGREKETQ